MLRALLDRLRLCHQEEGYDVKTYAERVQERQQLRAELDQHRAEKEAELTEIEKATSDLDYMDALADSFSGGPGNEGDNDGTT
jgi:hypothetical protein